MALNPNDLADAMVTALPRAWKDIKGEDFPGGDTKDMKLIFLAVARGLLTYLEAHQNDMIPSMMLKQGAAAALPYTVQALDLNTDLT